MPRVRPLRVPAHPRKYHDLLAWQTNEMTFSLDTYADRIAELRHKLQNVQLHKFAHPLRIVLRDRDHSELGIRVSASQTQG